MQHQRLLTLVVPAGAVLGLLLLGVPANADPGITPTAAGSGNVQPITAPPSAPLSRPASSAEIAHPNSALQGGGTSGCYGQTDRPHSSHHVTGTVNVVARTVCSGLAIHVDTTLYRSRWYGWEQRGSDSKNGTNNVSVNAADNDCDGTHDYLANSYHEAADGGTAATSNSANNLSCG